MNAGFKQFVPRNQCFNLPYNPDGGGGGGTTGGGGTGGGTTGTPSTGTSGLPVGENGGIQANGYSLLVPVQNASSGLAYLGYYDYTNLNDPDDSSSYAWRAEEIDVNAVPTVRRVAINYIDLGPLTLQVTISASNDLQQPISKTVTVQLGNAIPTYSLLTKFVDIQLTGFQPQLSIVRPANGGQMCLVAMTMYGEVEEVTR